MPRTVSHDNYMDEFDWFCYFPSRNFMGNTNPMFLHPYIGKNVFYTQYGSKLPCDKNVGCIGSGWLDPPNKAGVVMSFAEHLECIDILSLISEKFLFTY